MTCKNNQAPLVNASSVPLDANPGTLPNMQDAMGDYFQNTEFVRITKTVLNGQVVETRCPFSMKAIVANFTGQQLMMKEIGQRKWKWISVWAYPNIILTPDDVICYLGVNYRVDHKNDWSVYGYLQYDLVEDYKK